MEQGWDPGVKKFFVKILNTTALASIWMLVVLYAGIYHKLAYSREIPVAYTIIFYVVAVAGLFLLLRHLYKLWKNDLR